MKRLFLILGLLVGISQAQTTTTITGTIKDLTQALVTSGKVTFTLQPSRDTTISGLARFSPAQVVCLINASGLIKAQDGTSVCTLTMNTALNPPGTYYRVDVWPFNVKTSSFTFYAVLSTYDWSTVVPTPTTSPVQNFVDIFSTQTIGGNKTWSGSQTLTGSFTGTTGSFVNSGVFTNTQMNQYVTSSVNGLNFLTEAQYQNSGNFMTEGISAGIAVPSGATAWQSNALAGYVTNASTNPTLGAAVAVFGHARSLGVNSRVWAGNFTVSATLGTSSTNLNGIETDLNILNAGDGGIAYEATGGWLTQGTNVNGFYITKPNGGAFFWTTAFGTAIGATNTPTSTSAAVFLQQVATGTSQNSQGLTFLSTNSGGTPIAGLLYQLPTGDLQFSSSAAAPNLKINSNNVTQTIASGTATMTTAAIGAGACGTTVTVAATGALTTDSINHSFNGSVGANPGQFTFNKWPTANNVNFNYCNPTAGSITPSAATVNWTVTR